MVKTLVIGAARQVTACVHGVPPAAAATARRRCGVCPLVAKEPVVHAVDEPHAGDARRAAKAQVVRMGDARGRKVAGARVGRAHRLERRARLPPPHTQVGHGGGGACTSRPQLASFALSKRFSRTRARTAACGHAAAARARSCSGPPRPPPNRLAPPRSPRAKRGATRHAYPLPTGPSGGQGSTSGGSSPRKTPPLPEAGPRRRPCRPFPREVSS